MKRIFWSSVGYAAGISTSVYVQRRVRRAVEYYTPEQVREDVAARSRQVADKAREAVVDLREAAVEGVETMREREAELRREFTPDAAPAPTRHHRRASRRPRQP